VLSQTGIDSKNGGTRLDDSLQLGLIIPWAGIIKVNGTCVLNPGVRISWYAQREMRKKPMQVHVFRGKGRVFGITKDETGTNLPAQHGPWSPQKTLDMNRGEEPRAGVNTVECLDDIEKYGFHITDAHVRITESVI
jgi:hypothetical protein